MTKKGRQFFCQDKVGTTPSVAAPGDTNPSDATAVYTCNIIILVCLSNL